MKLISVTTALSPWNSFEGIPPAVLAEAARRGTFCHMLYAMYAQGLFFGAIPQEAQGFFDSFRRWFDKHVDKDFWTEKELVDEDLGIIGHADAGIRLRDGIRYVVDWKTAAEFKLTWGPQTAAYLRLTDKCCKENFDGAMILQPKKNGGMAKPEIFKKVESDRHWVVFVSSLNCYRFFKGVK